MILLEPAPNGVELAFGKVAELVKSFEHVNEILDGFRYQMGDYPLNSTPLGLAPPSTRFGVLTWIIH